MVFREERHLIYIYCFSDLFIGLCPWRRGWQPTPVFLPGKSHGKRSLTGYNLWSCKESDTTEPFSMHTRRSHTHTHTVPSRHSSPATTEHLSPHSQAIFQKSIYTCVLTSIFNLTVVRLLLPTVLLKQSDLSHPCSPCGQSQ